MQDPQLQEDPDDKEEVDSFFYPEEKPTRKVIKNIYFMLCYLIPSLRKIGIARFEKEEFKEDGLERLLCAILVEAVNYLIKNGMWQNFGDTNEDIQTIKGTIEINETIKLKINRKLLVNCTFNEFKIDTLVNQIIKSTLSKLLKCNLPPEQKIEIIKILRYFSGVSIINLRGLNWNLRIPSRNRYVKLAIIICRLINFSMIPIPLSNSGENLYFFDDKRLLHKIFENFVRGYLRQRAQKLQNEDNIKEKITVYDGGKEIYWVKNHTSDKLPRMIADIWITQGHSILIIDTKYYKDPLNKYGHFHSHNLYQILTYVLNSLVNENRNIPPPSEDNNISQVSTSLQSKITSLENFKSSFSPKHVKGMLLYAKANSKKDPTEDINLLGCNIAIRTVDLETDINSIMTKLNSILMEIGGNS